MPVRSTTLNEKLTFIDENIHVYVVNNLNETRLLIQ